MSHAICRTPSRSRRLVLSLALLALWFVPLLAHAEDDTCGPEIKKKEVEVFEVDTRHPGAKLDDLQAAEGQDWTVVLEDQVRSNSDPVRKAKIQAARRGCPIVIVGEVRREDSRTTVSVGGGFGGAPSARRGWTKVANVIYVEPAEAGDDTGTPER